MLLAEIACAGGLADAGAAVVAAAGPLAAICVSAGTAAAELGLGGGGGSGGAGSDFGTVTAAAAACEAASPSGRKAEHAVNATSNTVRAAPINFICSTHFAASYPNRRSRDTASCGYAHLPTGTVSILPHHCAGLRNGAVKCWGLNAAGELGNGTRTNSGTPVRVHSTTGPIKPVSGVDHNCALYSSGEMKCWGYNGSGEVGNRRTGDALVPVRVVGTPGVVWTSSDPGKATITDRGIATGRAAGNTTISATTAGFIDDNAVLTVK